MSAHQAIARDPFTGVQIRVGVMGSAREPVEPTVAALSRRLGRAIAERGCCLLTGACPGLPHEAVLGAIDPDPARLVDRLLGRYQSQEYVCPCRPGGRPGEGVAPAAGSPGAVTR